MFKQWHDMLEIYHQSNPKTWRALIHHPWSCAGLTFIFAFLMLLISALSMVWLVDSPYGPVWVFVFVAVSGLGTILSWELFLEGRYCVQYARHCIRDRNLLQREVYLHYAFFLGLLERNQIDSGFARRMAAFGEIARTSRKPLNLTQNTLLVWSLTILAALVVEWITSTMLWKTNKDATLIMAAFVPVLLVLYQLVLRGYRDPNELTVLFLKWASDDLKKPDPVAPS